MATIGPVVYSLTVNGTAIKDTPFNVSIEQAWGFHDIVAIRFEYNPNLNKATILTWPINAPVKLVWGQAPQTLQTWYGYVNHSEQKSNSDNGAKTLQYTFYCIGTSKPMNTQVSKNWGSVTATYIAKQMAKKYHLRCVVSTNSWVMPNIVQVAQSDFQFMNYIAQKAGMRFWVSGGTLYLIDPASVMTSSAQQGVPTFLQDKSQTKQDTMRDFQVLQGDNLPGSNVAQRSVSGVDATSGHVLSASTGAGQINIINTSRVVSSYSEAQSVLAGWQSLSQFWTGASAELFGNTLVYPGKLVYLQGNGLPGGNVGYWLVVYAKQLLKSSMTSSPIHDRYVTQVILMRNSSATVPKISNTHVISPEFTECVYSDGAWYSTNQSVIRDGQVNG